MDPYAKPGERKVGEDRPGIEHRPTDPAQPTTRQQRQIEKQRVAAERRAIKKSARRHLKRQLEAELTDYD